MAWIDPESSTGMDTYHVLTSSKAGILPPSQRFRYLFFKTALLCRRLDSSLQKKIYKPQRAQHSLIKYLDIYKKIPLVEALDLEGLLHSRWTPKTIVECLLSTRNGNERFYNPYVKIANSRNSVISETSQVQEPPAPQQNGSRPSSDSFVYASLCSLWSLNLEEYQKWMWL